MLRRLTDCLGVAMLLMPPIACDIDDSFGSISFGSVDENEPVLPAPFVPDGNEQELEESFLAPVVTGALLWAVNPQSNRVTALDSTTNTIQVLEAGNEPREITQLLKGNSTNGGVLVLNRKSQDVSVFYAAKDEKTGSSIAIAGPQVPVHAGTSSWATGNEGNFAIAWSRAVDGLLSPNDGYQDITVLDFRQAGENGPVGATQMAVGFRPESVMIAQGEERAVVVSQPGLSVIDLTDSNGPRVVSEIFVEREATSPRQINITKDGRYALISRSNSSTIEVLNLDTGTSSDLNFDAPVTDLDISDNGAVAVVVMRGSTENSSGAGGSGASSPSYASLIPLPAGLEDPTLIRSSITDEVFGSATIAANGSRSLLYSNGVRSEFVGIFNHENLSLRIVNVRAPVRAALVGESGKQGLVLCRNGTQDTFALLRLDEEAPTRIKDTTAPIAYVALSDSLQSAWVTTQVQDSGRATAFLGTFPSLSIDSYPLPSAPLAAGFIEETGIAHVAQSHPGGRITLLNLDEDKKATTITGFELSSEVVK